MVSAPCQKPVIERFERNVLPTGADSAKTPRNNQQSLKRNGGKRGPSNLKASPPYPLT